MDRFKAAKISGITGIFGNIFLLIIKGSVGLFSGSQAMIADAANSAADIFASLMTFIGNKIASEPGDENHNFGHGKAEYIFSLFISLSMMAVAIKLLKDAISSLIFGSVLQFSWWLVIFCITTIITKFCLFIYTNRLLKKYNNILIEATSKDHRNDCVVTTFTLISILATLVGIYWLDGIVGIAISLWIFYTGIKIFIESFNVLMDVSIDANTKDIILDLAHNYKEIKRVENLYSTPSGYKYVIVLTIFVDGNMSTFDSHNLADNLEKDISALDKIDNVIVHVNPI